MFLICHVISQDHAIKGPFDFMGESSSLKVTTLQNLVPIDTVVVEISEFLKILLAYSKCRTSVTVYTHLLPPLLFPLTIMVCHIRQVSLITT